MKKIKITAYQFNELNNEAKSAVIYWLDKGPIDYEDEDENGNIIKKIRYFTDMHNADIHEHCEANGYLFDKYGECVHHLIGK